jgi:hypothetical protein
MNYFLIANNESITDKAIEDLPIKEDDVIILYNRQMPIKWKKIKNHQNKILFLRGKESGYHGDNLLNKNKGLYREIILTGPTINDDEIDIYKNKYEISKLLKYSYSKDIEELNIFPKEKSPQSGLISYIYILNNLKYSKIYLIGFTNDYKTWYYKHSKDIEQNFYKKELEKGFIIKIDS